MNFNIFAKNKTNEIVSNLKTTTTNTDEIGLVESKVRTRQRDASASPIVNGSITQGRTSVIFDVNNVEHRQHYADFIAKNRWSDRAPRFFVEQPHISMPSMISAKMLEFYMNADKDLTFKK